MENSLEVIDEADLGYARQRFKNRVFTQLVDFFETEAQERDINQSDLAAALKKDAGQINRLLKHPSNLTLETISDLLTALEAEMETHVVRLADQPAANYMHPLMDRLAAAVDRAPTLPMVTINVTPDGPTTTISMTSGIAAQSINVGVNGTGLGYPSGTLSVSTNSGGSAGGNTAVTFVDTFRDNRAIGRSA